MSDWKDRTVTLQDLRRSAREYPDCTSSWAWLKDSGLVPHNVARMDIRQVLTDLDPDNIKVGYLAAAAYEWDTWGPATPSEFIRAIAAECRGAKRDLIMETLISLGREQEMVA